MLIKQGLRLVHSGSVTQANMKLATINAGAMIDIGVDWAAYTGDDAGSTPHMLILYDHLGNRMQGFIGASGAGLAYGVELITNGGFDADTNWAKIYFAIAGGKATSDGIKYASLSQAHSINSGTLLYHSINVITAAIACITWLDVENGNSKILIPNATGVYTGYATMATPVRIRYQVNSANVWEIDDSSLKRVTDISIQGVHLHSTRGGTNRNVASLDNSFDLNDSSGYTFKIYKCP